MSMALIMRQSRERRNQWDDRHRTATEQLAPSIDRSNDALFGEQRLSTQELIDTDPVYFLCSQC